MVSCESADPPLRFKLPRMMTFLPTVAPKRRKNCGATGVPAGELLQETLRALGMANSTYCAGGLEGCVPELAASLVTAHFLVELSRRCVAAGIVCALCRGGSEKRSEAPLQKLAGACGGG